MPDRPSDGPRPERWRRLGYLLPREIRERVFEPAFADLTYAWFTDRTDGRGASFGVRVLATWLGCVPIAIPRLFVTEGRLTRAGRCVVWGSAAAVVVVLVVVNLQSRYPTYGP